LKLYITVVTHEFDVPVLKGCKSFFKLGFTTFHYQDAEL